MNLSKSITVLLILSGLLTLPTYTYASLISHYRFDGNADDSSGNNYHGTVFGSSSSTTGTKGGALFLNNGYIDLPANTDLTFSPSDSFSLALWVNISEITTNGLDNLGIISNFKNHGTGHNWGLFINDGFAGATPGTFLFNPSGQRIDDNKWRHLAYVHDASNQSFQIYLNGLSLITISDTSSVSFGSNPISIGNHLNRLFPIAIDDLYVFDHNLTQTEINHLIPAPSIILLLISAALFSLVKSHRVLSTFKSLSHPTVIL